MKRRNVGSHCFRFACLILAVLAMPLVAHATAINFQLAGGAGVAGAQYVGTGAAALINNGGSPGTSDSGTVWNYATNNGSGGITTSIQATVDSLGNTIVNGPTLTVTAQQTYSDNSDGISLLNYWHLSNTNNPSNNTFSLTGVTNGTYDLYLYGVNGSFSADTPNTRGTTFTIGATSLGVNGSTNDSFVNGGNYVVFAGLVVTNGTISGTYIANALGNHSNNLEGQLNAVQLVSVVPEPSSLMLWILGMTAGLGLRSRRRLL